MKYRKKPIIIEAVQIEKRLLAPDWFQDAVSRNDIITHGMGKFGSGEIYVEIKTLEGVMRGDVGDYIIRGVKGEIYPCKADIFEMSYEATFEMSCEGSYETIPEGIK